MCCAVADVHQVAVIGLVLFANQFGGLVIFPFLPFMVHDFFPSTPKDQLGSCLRPALTIQGFILDSWRQHFISAGCARTLLWDASLSLTLQWGKLADKYGRRPILLCGIAGTLFAITLFGFRYLVALFRPQSCYTVAHRLRLSFSWFCASDVVA